MESKLRRGPRLTPPAAVAVPEPVPAPLEPPQLPAPAAVAVPEPMPAPLEPPQLAAPAPVPALPPPAPAPAAARGDALSALMQSQAALARGLSEMSAEMVALARGGIDAAGRSAGQMLAARTFADAVRINTDFARQSFDALIGGSARLSEIGMRLTAEASHPLLQQLDRGWAKEPQRGV